MICTEDDEVDIDGRKYSSSDFIIERKYIMKMYTGFGRYGSGDDIFGESNIQYETFLMFTSFKPICVTPKSLKLETLW